MGQGTKPVTQRVGDTMLTAGLSDNTHFDRTVHVTEQRLHGAVQTFLCCFLTNLIYLELIAFSQKQLVLIVSFDEHN